MALTPAATGDEAPLQLPRRSAIAVFGVFAGAYFLSALLRGVTATLAPALTEAFNLHARDLGLLSGGYFLGFAAMQLPLGHWLDRRGPRAVSLALLCAAVAGCAAFALAHGFASLMLARVLMGVGLAASLMAPLAGYRRWFDAGMQLRANAWMLMTGSLGMLASTLPVQALLPLLGWRGLFWGIAVLIVLAMAAIALQVPSWPPANIKTIAAGASPSRAAASNCSYSEVWRNAYFRRAVPLGAISFGGMVAIQSLWAGPWLTRVGSSTPMAAAVGLFCINLGMLLAFWGWGLVLPRLAARGITVDRLVARVQPFSFVALMLLVAAGPALGAASWVLLALYCVLSTPSAQVQAVVALALPSQLAGRALSAYNLAIFVGVFAVQWGIGLAADAFESAGLSPVTALRAAMALFGVLAAACWAHFVRAGRARRCHNPA